MRLAAHLGMTQGELLSRLTSSELTEWMAFDSEYNLPDAYYLVAALTRAIFGQWDKKRPTQSDLVPYFAPPPRKQSTADHKAFFAAISKKRV